MKTNSLVHKHLGKVEITDECLIKQKTITNFHDVVVSNNEKIHIVNRKDLL